MTAALAYLSACSLPLPLFTFIRMLGQKLHVRVEGPATLTLGDLVI